MKRSMSNKGDCWDNAVAESFFSTLEFECVRGVTYESYNALTLVLSIINLSTKMGYGSLNPRAVDLRPYSLSG